MLVVVVWGKDFVLLVVVMEDEIGLLKKLYSRKENSSSRTEVGCVPS